MFSILTLNKYVDKTSEPYPLTCVTSLINVQLIVYLLPDVRNVSCTWLQHLPTWWASQNISRKSEMSDHGGTRAPERMNLQVCSEIQTNRHFLEFALVEIQLTNNRPLRTIEIC